jgi:DNA-binding IclR family transcriptional regulator
MRGVDRTAAILLAFTAGEPLLGVSDISRRVEVPKSAVHRILGSLVRAGLVAREADGSRYRLGPRSTALGVAALGALDVQTIALPVMEELTKRTKETTTLSLLVGRERMYVRQVESPQDVRMTVETGRHYPLYAGASGRAILAFMADAERRAYLRETRLLKLTDATITDPERLIACLQEVRRLGFGASMGERDAWAAAVAAPIRLPNGGVIGSLSLCGPRARFGPTQVRAYGAMVREAAQRISRDLG